MSHQVYTANPTTQPGKYAALSSVKIYGTTCAAWDSVTGTPWADSCAGANVDFCSRGKNWCALPWCYVEAGCSGATATDVFKGSTAAFYSYNTCRGTPDCYAKHEAGCRRWRVEFVL